MKLPSCFPEQLLRVNVPASSVCQVQLPHIPGAVGRGSVVTLILARPGVSDTGSEQLAGAPRGYPLAGSGLVKKVSLEGREQNALCTSKQARS